MIKAQTCIAGGDKTDKKEPAACNAFGAGAGRHADSNSCCNGTGDANKKNHSGYIQRKHAKTAEEKQQEGGNTNQKKHAYGSNECSEPTFCIMIHRIPPVLPVASGFLPDETRSRHGRRRDLKPDNVGRSDFAGWYKDRRFPQTATRLCRPWFWAR